MIIYDIHSEAFKKYGRVICGCDFKDALKILEETPCPENSVIYEPTHPEMEACHSGKFLMQNCFGEMDIQVGYCNGRNKTLNCLEYHKSSEVNIAGDDIVLLLAKMENLLDFTIDSSHVEAFLVKKGEAVELFATTLHYAPCSAADGCFRVIIVLPRDTNTNISEFNRETSEDRLLWMKNKWLLAHKDSSEAKTGAFIGISGKNITID